MSQKSSAQLNGPNDGVTWRLLSCISQNTFPDSVYKLNETNTAFVVVQLENGELVRIGANIPPYDIDSAGLQLTKAQAFASSTAGPTECVRRTLMRVLTKRRHSVGWLCFHFCD